MATTTEPRINVYRIADRLGGHSDFVRTWANRLGFDFQVDWEGEESLTVTEAAKLVQEVETVKLEHERRWREHQAALGDYEWRKIEAGNEAYRKVIEARRQRDFLGLAANADFATVDPQFYSPPSGATRDEAREARAEAMEKFERRNRRPIFEVPR